MNTLRKTGICDICNKTLYGDEYGAAGHKCISTITLAEAIQKAEEWCGYDAYETDYDKSCDEHTCDRCRGVNCSADELLNFLKTLERMRIEKTVAASELSPCPFCGGYALFDIRDRKGFVFCNKCKARTNEFFDPFLPLRLVALLIEAWNTRAEKKLID